MQPPRRNNNNQGNNPNRGGGMMPRHNHKNRHNNNRNNNQNRGGQQQGPRINISQVTNQRDKYLNMARDAQHSGDRVITEYYLQHADHYQRLINEFNEEQESRRAQVAQQQDTPAAEETGETTAAETSETVAEQPQPRQRQDRRQRQPRERTQPQESTDTAETENFSVASILPPPIRPVSDDLDQAAAADGE